MRKTMTLIGGVSLALTIFGAVPLRWTVETSRVQPAVFEVVRGETIALEAAFNSYGKPLAMAGKDVAIFWQTNGMGTAWWQGAAVATSNRIAATFTPQMDPGDRSVTGFLGATGDIYRAAFTLRFRPGPGSLPNVIANPVPVLDLSRTVVIAAPWPTQADYAATTTVMRAELKTYIDQEIAGAGLVSPQAVTNISGSVTSNVVTKSYVESLGIEAGLTEEQVRGVVASTSVTNGGAKAYADGTFRTMVDNTCHANTFTQWTQLGQSPSDYTFNLTQPVLSERIIYGSFEWYWEWTDIGNHVARSLGTWLDKDDALSSVKEFFLVGDFVFEAIRKNVSTSNEPYVTPTYVTNAVVTRIDASTNGLARTSDVYPVAAGQQLAGQVSAIASYLNAEDARFVSTNYNSLTRMPEAYVEIKLPDQSWSVIWKEMTRWNWLIDSYLPTNFYTKTQVNQELLQKADRAWGAYDSETGGFAPDGYTWISSPRIAIAADMAYQRTITSEGAVWVLESSGTVTETGGTVSNGLFRISDDEGHSIFEIVKGDKRTVGADAASCQVVSGFTPTKLQIGYSIVSDAHPTLYVCQSLTNPNWKAETDADCIANVTWSGTSGAYVAQVQGKSAYSSMFVRATYEVGGESYIRNLSPVSMQYIIIGSQKYAVGTATISGHTVMTLTPAGN